MRSRGECSAYDSASVPEISERILRGEFRNGLGVNIQQTIPIRVLLDPTRLFKWEVRHRRDSQSRPEEIYSPVLCYDYRS